MGGERRTYLRPKCGPSRWPRPSIARAAHKPSMSIHSFDQSFASFSFLVFLAARFSARTANSRTSTHERTRKSHETIGARAQCGGERVRSAVCRARPPSARTYYLFVDADALLPAVHAAHAAAVLALVASRALRRLRPIKMRSDDMSRTSKLRANAVALDPS